MSEPSVVLRELRTAGGHRFGHATLNAPASLNALTLEMIDLLAPQFDAWWADPGVVGIVLDGAGDKAFCAGGDVQALYHAVRALGPAAAETVPELAKAFFEREYRFDHRLHSAPKPLLVWGHGIVMGGGVGLLAAASHRVVTPRSRIAMPEISIGLYPDVGASWFLHRMPGQAGLFLGLTGVVLNATDACFGGLADLVVEQETKASVFDAIGAARWDGDPAADGARLSRLLGAASVPLDPAASPLRRHAELIDRIVGHDTLAAIDERLRALGTHDDPWLAGAVKTFQAGSPTSAALTHALWRRTEGWSLDAVFRLEYQVSLGCCLQHDFCEGVRAVLVDKDRRPHWQPATLAEVGAALIDAHFEPRHAGEHPLADLGRSSPSAGPSR